MRLRSVTVLALSLAFASYGSLTLRAQDASVAPGTEIDSCVRWMKATASGGVTRTLDPADFCSGIKRGSTDGCTRSGNAASYHNRSLARRPGIALRLAYSPRVRPGRLVLAPQPRTDASCCTEHRIRRRTCTARPRRSTAELQCGWEGSGCLQECTSLRRLSRPMGGSLPSPSSMENIWEASR